MTALLDEIRQRAEPKNYGGAATTMTQAEDDRRTLLRLLDATREELADALGRIDRLTGRVVTAETGRTDAADLQRELDEMRRAWADTPTTVDAIAKLREWVPDYEIGASMVAMPVAMARKLLAALADAEAAATPEHLAAVTAQRDRFAEYVPIEELTLNMRAYNVLTAAGIRSVGELLRMTEDDVTDLRNAGKKTLQNVKERLRDEFGLTLRQAGAP